ncbi:MAG: nitroreductase family protein [Bacteroidota bacterium]
MGHITYPFEALPEEQMIERADAFYELMDRRRSIRFFSDKPVPRHLIERAIQTAGTAPSGAHRQPWTFVAIDDPEVKREIRTAAEAEEYESYTNRMNEEWLEALEPIGTNWQKPFLETAPYIVICFAQNHGFNEDGSRQKHYYVQESVGLACGMFIAALHNMGLVTLTHTPSPMRFLTNILGRPGNERPYILFPVGYPTEDATVPDFGRKPLDEILVWNKGE